MNDLRDFAKIERISQDWFDLLWRAGDVATRKELARRAEIDKKYLEEIFEDEELLQAWSSRKDREPEDILLALKGKINSAILYNISEQENLPTQAIKTLTKLADNPVAQSLLKRRDISDRSRHNLIAKFIHSVEPNFNFSTTYYGNDTGRRLITLFGNKVEFFITALANCSWFHSVILVESITHFKDEPEIVRALIKKFKEDQIPAQLLENQEFERDITQVIETLVTQCSISASELAILLPVAKSISGEVRLLVDRNIKFDKLLEEFIALDCSKGDITHAQALENIIGLSSKHNINRFNQEEIVPEIARHAFEIEFDAIYYWYKKNNSTLGAYLLEELLLLKDKNTILNLVKLSQLPPLKDSVREAMFDLLIESNEHKVLKARVKNEELVRYINNLKPLYLYLDREMVINAIYKECSALPIEQAEIVLSLLSTWSGNLRELLELSNRL